MLCSRNVTGNTIYLNFKGGRLFSNQLVYTTYNNRYALNGLDIMYSCTSDHNFLDYNALSHGK